MKRLVFLLMVFTSFIDVNAQTIKSSNNMLVRISEIEVFPQYLKEYLSFALNVGAESVKEEAGVIAIYPMVQKRDSCQIRILEIYANDAAYRSHIKTSHFQTYKQGTLKMVKNLDLVDMFPLNEVDMPNLFKKMAEPIYHPHKTVFKTDDKASNKYNTGEVYVSVLKDSGDTMITSFLFNEKSRNFWHYHPDAEQTLMVIEGEGYYQEEGKPKQTIRKGDVIITPANVRHWNGASPDKQLECITVTEHSIENHAVQLKEVSEKEYMD
ncbi:MAG: cupin domain-containing protein [Bacteroidales bacterium]|nr:cupin domain-containing protein [Bacteroidales bacterium]